MIIHSTAIEDQSAKTSLVPSDGHRPLSRRLDRCDRVIHNESGDPNGGNMCSFSGAMCTSRDVTMQITFLTRKSALIYRRDLRQRVASLTLNCNGVLAIRAYCRQFSTLWTGMLHDSLSQRAVCSFQQRMHGRTCIKSGFPLRLKPWRI